MYLWAVVHTKARCVTLPVAIPTSLCVYWQVVWQMGPASTAAYLPLPIVGESSRCHDMGVHFQKPLTGGSLGFDVPAAVEKLKFTLWDPKGPFNRVLHLANGLIGSKVKPPILQSLFRPCYSAESQYVVMYSTRCQQCGALGESHDPGSLFKRWWMQWWMERGALMDMHSGIEGAHVSWGLSSWQYTHYYSDHS